MSAPRGRHSAALDGKTLRIALAMRGGVSMAVWIGGAVAEFDLLRRASLGVTGCVCRTFDAGCANAQNAADRRAHEYRRLLTAAGYGPVEFDILAGASAGGLNAVLYALAQSYGVVTDRTVGQMWSRDGDLWDLIREPGWDAVPSLLQGDGRFLTLAETALDAIADPEENSRIDGIAADQIAVELAATLLTDHEQQLGNRANFSFVRRPGGLHSAYSTIPGVGDDDTSARLARRRMALAARSTSSFPGAFEPASVHSVLGAGAVTANGIVNMASVFPFAREGVGDLPAPERLGRNGDGFNVIDGGVFDNIPIDRALRAIQRASASDPSERHLIYLDPQPPQQIELPKPPEGMIRDQYGILVPDPERSWLRRIAEAVFDRHDQVSSVIAWPAVISGAKALQKRQESADEEVKQIWRHNAAQTQVRDRMNALGGSVPRDDGAGGYLDYRIGSETQRLGELLDDPVVQMCCRPHDSRPFHGASNDVILPLRREVQCAYRLIGGGPLAPEPPVGLAAEELAQAQAVFEDGDLGRLIDVARILIAWVQQLQVLPSVANTGSRQTADLTDLKAGLYRCLTVLTEGRRLCVDESLVCGSDSPLSALIVNGIRRQRDLGLSDEVSARLAPAAGTFDESAFYCDLAAPGSDGCTGIGLAYDAPAPGSALLPTLRGLMTDYLDQIRRWAPTSDPADTANAWEYATWNRTLFATLVGLPSITIADLTALCAQSGVPDTASTVRYTAITGDTEPAIELPDLVDAAIDDQLQSWLRAGVDPASLAPEPRARLMEQAEKLRRADTKLAGTVLARFGGFLDSGWRRNDWCWGKLDATAGVVGLLMPTGTAEDRKEVVAGLQRNIVDAPELDCVPLQSVSPKADAPEKTVGDVLRDIGGESLDNLPIGYRFGVVARMIPLLLRALWPPESSGGGIKGIATRIGLIAARPVIPIATLAGDLLRLVAAVGIAMLAAAALGASGTRWVGQAVFVTALALAGLCLLWRATTVRKRWAALREFFDDRRWRVRVDRGWRRARRHWMSSVALGGALLVVGVGWWVVKATGRIDVDDTFGTGSEFMAMVAVCVGLALWYLNHEALMVRTKPLHRTGIRNGLIWGTWVLFFLIGVVAYLAAANGECVDEMMSSRRASCDSATARLIVDYVPGYGTPGYAAVVAAIAVAALTALSLSFWAGWRWVGICSVALAAIAAGLQLWLEHALADAGWLDLLPVVVWLTGVGVLQQRVRPLDLENVARRR